MVLGMSTPPLISVSVTPGLIVTDAPRIFRELIVVLAARGAVAADDKKDDAAKSFSEFESLAVKVSGSADNANRELIEYYADYAKEPAKALQLAEHEAAKRHDIYTLDSYAWSLAANGDYAHAQTEMQKALATGVKDPHILEHASAIAQHVE